MQQSVQDGGLSPARRERLKAELALEWTNSMQAVDEAVAALFPGEVHSGLTPYVARACAAVGQNQMEDAEAQWQFFMNSLREKMTASPLDESSRMALCMRLYNVGHQRGELEIVRHGGDLDD